MSEREVSEEEASEIRRLRGVLPDNKVEGDGDCIS